MIFIEGLIEPRGKERCLGGGGIAILPDSTLPVTSCLSRKAEMQYRRLHLRHRFDATRQLLLLQHRAAALLKGARCS